MKTNQRSFLSVFVFICALFVGCDSPVLHNRPSDKACMQWLHGKKLTLEKGIIFDDEWVIDGNSFTKFDISSITPNDDGSLNATAQFEMKNVNKMLRVEGRFIYRHHKKDDVIEFISFTTTRLLKLGKW